MEARMRVGPGGHVVLVVEDEPLVRCDIASEFRAHGWDVIEAASGEQAVALTTENQIDIVVTDIQLAGQMSGWEMAEAMRAAAPTVPILYTSAKSNNPARQVSGSLFVGKPYEPAFVIEVCHNLLDDAE
jgi:CheY-like chemotaxis protein